MKLVGLGFMVCFFLFLLIIAFSWRMMHSGWGSSRGGVVGTCSGNSVVYFFIIRFAEIGLLTCGFQILSTFSWLRTLWASTIRILIEIGVANKMLSLRSHHWGLIFLFWGCRDSSSELEVIDSLPFSKRFQKASCPHT